MNEGMRNTMKQKELEVWVKRVTNGDECSTMMKPNRFAKLLHFFPRIKGIYKYKYIIDGKKLFTVT
jgi:hypothetical protein